MKSFRFLLFVCLLAAVSAAGCSGSQVTRVDVDETIDLSGRWNDSDSRLTAKEMIDDCLRRSWQMDFVEVAHRKPVVIVGSVVNRSHDHINAEVFVKDLERSLLNSGKVKFVADSGQRGEIREERLAQNQDGFTDPATIKALRKETGADFMLIGSINSIKDEFKGRYVILYQVNLELIDLENNEKVWIGQQHLKKVVKRSKFSL